MHAGSQTEPQPAGYQRLAEPQTQAQRGAIDREPATAIVDQGLGVLGITTAIPFGLIYRRWISAGVKFPAVGIGVPAQGQLGSGGLDEHVMRLTFHRPSDRRSSG